MYIWQDINSGSCNCGDNSRISSGYNNSKEELSAHLTQEETTPVELF